MDEGGSGGLRWMREVRAERRGREGETSVQRWEWMGRSRSEYGWEDYPEGENQEARSEARERSGEEVGRGNSESGEGLSGSGSEHRHWDGA